MIALAALCAVTLLAAEAPSATAPTGAPDPAPAAAAAAARDREGDVRRLLVASGGVAMAQQMIGPMLQQMGKLLPDVPPKLWTEVEGEMKADDLVDMLVPIYLRHFSADEVKAMIAFYESPVGRSFVKHLPAVTQESYAAGSQWGRAAAQRVIERLRAKGFEPRLQAS